MILVLLITEAGFFHFCGHDEFQRRQSPFATQVTYGSIDSSIRIKFNLPDYENDDQICKTIGTSITWNYKTYTCTANDLISNSKKNALENTLNNVKDYFSSFLKVHPLIGSYNPKDFLDTTITEMISGDNTDVQIDVFVRPFGCETKQALTAIVQIDEATSRPIQSVMFINSKKIPKTAQSATTDDSRVFWSLVHETLHAIGISSILFPKFHPTTSNDPYSNSNTFRSGKRNFLITPNAHTFAINHYDRNTLSINGESFASGIELDTFPESTSSHPNIRRYL